MWLPSENLQLHLSPNIVLLLFGWDLFQKSLPLGLTTTNLPLFEYLSVNKLFGDQYLDQSRDFLPKGAQMQYIRFLSTSSASKSAFHLVPLIILHAQPRLYAQLKYTGEAI